MKPTFQNPSRGAFQILVNANLSAMRRLLAAMAVVGSLCSVCVAETRTGPWDCYHQFTLSEELHREEVTVLVQWLGTEEPDQKTGFHGRTHFEVREVTRGSMAIEPGAQVAVEH